MYTKGPTTIKEPSTPQSQNDEAPNEYAIPRLESSLPILAEILWYHTIEAIPKVIGATIKNNKQKCIVRFPSYLLAVTFISVETDDITTKP